MLAPPPKLLGGPGPPPPLAPPSSYAYGVVIQSFPSARVNFQVFLHAAFPKACSSSMSIESGKPVFINQLKTFLNLSNFGFVTL